MSQIYIMLRYFIKRKEKHHQTTKENVCEGENKQVGDAQGSNYIRTQKGSQKYTIE